MAKEKKLKEVENKDYFKEMVSFFITLLMIIFLGNLGTLGYYGSLIIKLIFGEWSFLILIFILVDSIFYMIKSRTINIHSLTLQGLIFIYLAITLMSHLTIYNSLGLIPKNVFSSTLKLYKTYFKSFDNSYYVGGGIVGLLLFQICIFLLGKIGVIIIGVSFIIIGLSYLCNNTVWDFLRKFTRLYSIINIIRHKILNFLRKFSLMEKKTSLPKKPKISLSLLNDIKESSNLFLQRELAKEYSESIISIIKKDSLPINFLNYYVGYNSTTYLLELKTKNIDKSFDILLKLFEYQVFYIIEENKLYLETKNRFKELLTLKKVLTDYNIKDSIPIGLNNPNDLISYDLNNSKQLLIVGSINSGIKTYVRIYITSLILLLKDNFIINIIDLKHSFKEFKGLINHIEYIDILENVNRKIEELIFEYDKRYEVLKYLECSDYIEANLIIDERFKQLDHIKPIFTFLNINLKYLSSEYYKKLIYLISVSRKVGFYIILILREEDKLEDLNLSLFNLLVFKLKDISMSLKILNSDIACMLDSKGDFLYLENKKISHGQTPYCSMTDYLKILEKFTF